MSKHPCSAPLHTELIRGVGAEGRPSRRGSEVLQRLPEPRIATLGNFDGVHLGHQRLLSRVRALKGAHGCGIAVTFAPHPALVLGRAQGAPLPVLTTLRERCALLRSHGLDLTYVIHFTPAFSQLSAAAFVKNILIETLQIERLVIGPDARVGHHREGTPEVLAELLRAHGKEVEIVDFLEQGGIRVSSRTIRTLVEEGGVGRAAELLGRPHMTSGRVVRGDGRGKGIGVPTANLRVAHLGAAQAASSPRIVLPGRGVYCGIAEVAGYRFGAVANVGLRPTIYRGDPALSSISVEVHLLDYEGGDFYGHRLRMWWLERLRDERRFDGLASLRLQIDDDIARAREIIGCRKDLLQGER